MPTWSANRKNDLGTPRPYRPPPVAAGVSGGGVGREQREPLVRDPVLGTDRTDAASTRRAGLLAGASRRRPGRPRRCTPQLVDRGVRAVCAEYGSRTRGSRLLTPPPPPRPPRAATVGERYGRGVAQVVFRIRAPGGMIPLTGTADADTWATTWPSSTSPSGPG